MPEIPTKHSLLDAFMYPRSQICQGNWYLYVVCRYLKPSTVVETGIYKGVSSACILQALHDNGKGRLFSIDLPNVKSGIEGCNCMEDFSLNGRRVGYLVPKHLEDRWNLKIGDAKQKLPELLSE